MASAIDTTKPVFGNPTTQSVRDNFSAAASEITALQDAVGGANMSGMVAGQIPIAATATSVASSVPTSTFVTGGPYLPTAGGTLSGALGIGGTPRSTIALDVPGGNVAATNYRIEASAPTAAGTVGFANANGPSIVFTGSGTGTPGAMFFNYANAAVLEITGPGTVIPAADQALNLGLPGSAMFQVVSYHYVTSSAASLKRDIAPLTPMLDRVMRLAPKGYRWRGGADTERRHAGFIAGEVRDVLGADFGGYHATTDKDGVRHEGIAYHELTAVLWQAVQELKAEIDMLKAGKA